MESDFFVQLLLKFSLYHLTA